MDSTNSLSISKQPSITVKTHPHSSAEYQAAHADGTKCTWYPGMSAEEKAKSPHTQRPWSRKPFTILNSALDAVGDTPLIRLNRIPVEENLACEVVAKCEFFNAGGSVKDRIGKRMIEDAEKSGRIKPGDTLIEPTSGNTGIGLALAAALKGYRMIITLPEKMSQEKVDVLKALGAEIIRTPTEAAFDSPESHIGVAKKLNREIPNSHILDQYGNPSNPLAHYEGTAEEIWAQCQGKVDMVVMTAGTGGTLTGIARRLKELNPAILVVGVDPKGSILAQPEPLNDEKRLQSYVVEGIGYDFIPAVLDRSLVDYWVKTDDAESLIMARRLIRQEGLLCGGSSGAAVVGAMKAAAVLKPGQRCVVLLADSIRNYMSKHLNDSFMWGQGFVSEEYHVGLAETSTSKKWWASRTVGEMGVPTPITVTSDLTASQAVDLLTSNGIDQLPVVDESNNIVGVITEGNLSTKLMAGKLKPSDPVSKALYKQFRKVTVSTPLSELGRVFDKDPFAVVVQTQKLYTGNKDKNLAVTERHVVVGVVSRIDMLRFITEGAAAGFDKDVSSTPNAAGGNGGSLTSSSSTSSLTSSTGMGMGGSHTPGRAPFGAAFSGPHHQQQQHAATTSATSPTASSASTTTSSSSSAGAAAGVSAV